MLQKLLIMFGFGSVDGALAGLQGAMKDLERVRAHKEQESEIADEQVAAYQVKRDEADKEAARAERVLEKMGALLS